MTSRRLLIASVCLMAATAPTLAQTFNYKEFEDLFGEPVTTSATGSPQRRSEVPATMNIITAEDIRRSGAITIPQILSRIAGIDVYTWSKNSADVSIRGLNQGAVNRVMVMINGRENYTDGFGTFFWQFFPVRIDEIRQIEVIKGPNSALYGFNAAAGVINIITYNPQHEKVNAERLTMGTDGTQEVSAVQSTQWDKGGARVSAFSSKVPVGDFHPAWASDLIAAAPHSETRTANLDTQVQLGDSTYVRLQSGVSVGNLRSTFIMPIFTKYRIFMNQAEITSETGIGDLRFFVSNNNYELSDIRSSIGTGTSQNSATVAKLQDVFKIGAADTFRIGVEYRHNVLPTSPKPTEVKSQTASVSGMWLHAFNENFTWLNAARLDRFTFERPGAVLPGSPFTAADYDRSFTGTSYNSAMVYRPSQLDAFKLMAARGLQLPSLTELGASVANDAVTVFAGRRIPFTLFTLGNPNLTPSTTNHYEASYERQIPELTASGRIAAYHQDVKNLRDPSAPQLISRYSPDIILKYQDMGGVRLNGLEVEASGKFLTDWRWTANYAYEKVRNQNFIDDKKNFAQTTPRHKVNLSVGWSKGPWETDAFVRYVSSANLFEQVDLGTFKLQESGPVWALSQRVAYQVTPQLRTELVVSSKFADNTLYTEKARAILSLVGSF